MSNTIYSDKIKVNCPLVCDESGYFHLVYQITNLVNGKVYVGKHSTKDPYDGYFGSGDLIKQALKKYKLENFIKELLFCFTNENEAFLKEAEIVTQEFINRDDTYNIKLGGYGFRSDEVRGERNGNYGKPMRQETRDKLSKINKGKRLSQETKDKMSKSRTGKNHPLYGKKHRPESLKMMSESHSGAKSSTAKAILKTDEFGNIVIEYGCKNDCREREGLSRKILDKLINKHILHNGFYFEYKNKG